MENLEVDPFFAEPVIMAVAQDRADVPDALTFAATLLGKFTLKASLFCPQNRVHQI
jgi:hypothetical protein